MHGQFLEYSIKCLENFPLAIPLSLPRNPLLDCVTIIVGKWAGDTWYMIYSTYTVYRWYMAHSVNWYPHIQNGGRVAEGHLSPSGSDLRIFFSQIIIMRSGLVWSSLPCTLALFVLWNVLVSKENQRIKQRASCPHLGLVFEISMRLAQNGRNNNISLAWTVYEG